MELGKFSKSSFLYLAVMVCVLGSSVMAQDKSKLTLNYYDKSCPTAQQIVRKEMDCAVRENPRNAAAILRLHFHDCFVQVSETGFSDNTPHIGQSYLGL